MSRFAIYGITVVWFISIFAGLTYLSLTSVEEFDPNHRLLKHASDPEFDRVFTDQLKEQYQTVSNTVFHFRDEECRCNSTAKDHIDSVYLLAVNSKLTNRTINIKDVSFVEVNGILPVIPSTPAIAIFNNKGKLTYFGPYSAGYTCSVGNGIVESFIERIDDQQGASIVADTLGCYCALGDI